MFITKMILLTQLKVTITITSFDKDVQLKFNSASNTHGSCNNKVIESLHHDSRIQNLGILRDNVSGMSINDVKLLLKFVCLWMVTLMVIIWLILMIQARQ